LSLLAILPQSGKVESGSWGSEKRLVPNSYPAKRDVHSISSTLKPWKPRLVTKWELQQDLTGFFVAVLGGDFALRATTMPDVHEELVVPNFKSREV
jgi:hypothetical protein